MNIENIEFEMNYKSVVEAMIIKNPRGSLVYHCILNNCKAFLPYLTNYLENFNWR